MRKFAMIFGLLFFAGIVQGQDLRNEFNEGGVIITKGNDTVEFTRAVRKESINFRYWVEGSDEERYYRFNDGIFAPRPEYKLVKNEVDEFEGFTRKITNEIDIAYNEGGDILNLEGYIGQIINSESKSTYLYVGSGYMRGCSGADGNYLIIKFVNGEILRFEDDLSDIDCSIGNNSIFQLDESDLEKLKTNDIKAIRFCQTEGYADFHPFFPDVLKGLVNLL